MLRETTSRGQCELVCPSRRERRRPGSGKRKRRGGGKRKSKRKRKKQEKGEEAAEEVKALATLSNSRSRGVDFPAASEEAPSSWNHTVSANQFY